MAISIADLDALLSDPRTPALHAAANSAVPSIAGSEPQHPGAAKPVTSLPSVGQTAVPDIKSAPSEVPSIPGTAQAALQKPASTWQKIGHGFEKAANIAGDVLAPGVTTLIPGSDLNKQWQQMRQSKLDTAKSENDLREAEAKGWKPMTFTGPNGETFEAPSRFAGQFGTATIRGNTAENIQGEKTQAQKDLEKQKQDFMKPYDDALENYHDAQTALANSKNDPNSPEYKLQQEKLDQAKQALTENIARLNLSEQQFGNKVQEQNLVKPSGQTISRSDAAGAALQQLPALEQAIKENGSSLGPIMGRIKKGEIKLGDVDPATQKLYSTLESFYSQQPAIHGFRNAEFVKDFDSFIGNLQTNPDAVIAGLEGLRPTLEAVEKSGRTYHKRIVEGDQNQGGGKPAPSGNTGDPLGIF